MPTRAQNSWHIWAKRTYPNLTTCQMCGSAKRLARHCPNHEYNKREGCDILCSLCHGKANADVRKQHPKARRKTIFSGKRQQILPWMKWWIDGTLYGSLSTASLDEVGFLLKICALAQKLGQDGNIQKKPDVPYTHSEIATLLGLTVDVLERHLAIQINEKRISQNGSGVLAIDNFYYYQRERGIPPTQDEGEEDKDGT